MMASVLVSVYVSVYVSVHVCILTRSPSLAPVSKGVGMAHASL